MLTAAIFIQTAVTLACTVIVTFSLEMRQAPKSTHYMFLALALFNYSIGYLFELISPDLGSALMACRLQYLGIPFISPNLYLFALDYANRSLRSTWLTRLLRVSPVVFSLLMITYPSQRLFYTDVQFVANSGAPHLVVTPGPALVFSFLYSFFFMVATVITLLRHALRSSGKERHRAGMFLLISLLPPASLAVYLLGVAPGDFDYSPLVLTLALGLLGLFILRFEAQEWLPYARDMVLEKTHDAYVLLDTESRFLDANEAAYAFFPALRRMRAGMPLSDVPDMPEMLYTASNWNDELVVEQNGQQSILRVSRSPVVYSGRIICYSVLAYDVTEYYKLLREMQELATHDTLTGLLNRGTFFQAANRHFDLARRSQTDTTLLMLDIDHFKKVNDTYGHLQGDEVLRQVAKVLTARLRHTDICGRYGGEEIAILLPDTALAGGSRTADDIRQAIAALPFAASEEVFHITVSIGVASLGCHKTLESLIADADMALYRAKSSGRNQICRYEDIADKPGVDARFAQKEEQP